MTVAIFTPTRHPGIAVSAYSVARQTHKDVVWLVADQIGDRSFMELNVQFKTVWHHEPVKEGRLGNLAAVSNWALRWCRDNDIELLVFLQDFIWMPPFGVKKFLNDARVHPFALLTGCVQSSKGWPVKDASDPWDIFGDETERTPPLPYELDTRQQMGMKPGRVSNHAWEINYGALPHALINAGVDFDEDYDYGTQWENTQFSFDMWRYFNTPSGGGQGYVWWNPSNRAVALPHREYFPATHAGEKSVRNDELFWKKNPDLIGRT